MRITSVSKIKKLIQLGDFQGLGFSPKILNHQFSGTVLTNYGILLCVYIYIVKTDPILKLAARWNPGQLSPPVRTLINLILLTVDISGSHIEPSIRFSWQLTSLDFTGQFSLRTKLKNQHQFSANGWKLPNINDFIISRLYKVWNILIFGIFFVIWET